MHHSDAGSSVSPETMFNGAMFLAESLILTMADMTTGTIFHPVPPTPGPGEHQMRRAAESPPMPTPHMVIWIGATHYHSA